VAVQPRTFLKFLLCGTLAAICATPETANATLGNYPNTTVLLSGNTTVIPDAAPTNTTSINVSTSTDFKGRLEGNPGTGVVRVTDAHPDGTYMVTVTGFDSGGGTTLKTFTLTVTIPATCNPVSFAAATNFAAGTGSVTAAVGDFNGDGNQDLGVANTTSDNVSILLGNGAGSLSVATNFNAGDGPTRLTVGDFNGDGEQDLAVANNTSDNVSILLGNGAGNFGAATNFDVGNFPVSVAVGDFNSDGKQDLAVANLNSDNVSILLGNGAGSFSAPANFATGSLPSFVAVGNFNGDGNQDLAVANEGSNNVSVLLGNGAGSFNAATNFNVGGNPLSVAVGHFNGDGNQDLAVANFASNNVSVLLGNGAGSFSAATNFGAGTNPVAVGVGDFNGDGNQDIATANQSSNDVSVLLGNGAGNFGSATNVGAGSNPDSVGVGDFNGDGKQDLVTANAGSNNVSVLLRQCIAATPTPPSPTPSPTPTSTPCVATFAANFDGVTAPALPGGWTTAFTGVEVPWVISTTSPASAPNDAFAPDVSNKGNTHLITPAIPLPAGGGILTFQNLFNMQANATTGFDGMVLEISINGGAFADILAAGGSFATGGYTRTISADFGNPIAGRLAWSGLSAGTTDAPAYITTTVNLPAAANGQNIQLMWRAATDNSAVAPGAAGVRIDNIVIAPASCGTPVPTPTPPSTATPGVTPVPTATPGSSATPTPAQTPTPTSTPINASSVALVEIYDLDQSTGKLANMSTRAFCSTGGDIIIAGLILGNNAGPDSVVLRGIGPSLAAAGLPAATLLANPTLELRDGDGTLLFSNNDWQDNAAQAALITGAGLAPSNNLEAAIFATLPPGLYTVLMAGLNNTTGNGLVEVYDLLAASGAQASQAINLSTRMQVLTGDRVGFGGFIIAGSAPKHVLIRAIGPSLRRFGFVDVLADPLLELHGPGGFATFVNNNWRDTQEAAIQATGIPPTNDLESAIDATLAPGAYTAIVKGNGPGGPPAPTATPTPASSPTPSPASSSTPTPTSSPTSSPTASPGSSPTISPISSPTPTPTPTPSPTSSPTPALSPTPSPTSSPTPTPAATPTPSPSGPCTENFDGVSAPALPAGWVATLVAGDPPTWETSTTAPDSAPNDAFVPNQDGISDKTLDSRNITINSASSVLSFRNNFDTEHDPPPAEVFWDGYVLEVSVAGGTFQDIIDAGGVFTAGPYTGEIDGTANNPLAGRMAWSGNSGGYIDTSINLPASLNGQTIRLRFRMGTDEAVAAPGARVDGLFITSASCP
jgi:hypothetical protein